MSVLHMGRGQGEGRAAIQAVVDRPPSAPLVSEEHKMIAFAHASQRLFSRAVAKSLDLFSRLCDVMAEVRENRRKLETELFRNRNHHSSKNDDDLPIVR
jgi:hypothetical protein